VVNAIKVKAAVTIADLRILLRFISLLL